MSTSKQDAHPMNSSAATPDDSSSTNKAQVGLLHHQFIHANVRALAPTNTEPEVLPTDFSPTNYDVICGKGKMAYNHIGNRRFRITIDLHLPRYQAAISKADKSAVVHDIVNLIRKNASSGFVRFNPKMIRWIEIGDIGAREKVGQAIRDSIDPIKQKARNAARRKRRRGSSRTASPKQSVLASVSGGDDSSEAGSTKSAPAQIGDAFEPLAIEEDPFANLHALRQSFIVSGETEQISDFSQLFDIIDESDDDDEDNEAKLGSVSI